LINNDISGKSELFYAILLVIFPHTPNTINTRSWRAVLSDG